MNEDLAINNSAIQCVGGSVSQRTELTCSARMSHSYWINMTEVPQTVHDLSGVLGVMVLFCSLAGNLSVIFLVIRFRSLRSISNIFVINLTVADSVLSIGNIPMFIASSFNGNWLFGYTGCQIYAFIGSLSSFVSINTLAAMAVERALVLLKPLPVQNRVSKKYFCIAITVIWIYSAFWATVPFFGFGRYILEGTDTSCTFDFFTQSILNRVYVLSISIAHFVLPVGIIVCSYTLIYRAIVFHQRMFSDAQTTYGEASIPLRLRKNNHGIRYETKVAKASVIVVTVFCASWTPYATVALIGVFSKQPIITRLGAGIPCVLAKFSTVVNPFLYALLHPKFRKKLHTFYACNSSPNDNKQLGIQRGVLHYRSTKLDCSPDIPGKMTTSM